MRWYVMSLVWLLVAVGSARAEERMNVIVVFVDDLGVTDLQCDGNTFHETPHLNKLAEDGMRFTAGYAACTVCSPSRAALMTGQYPARLHITDWIAGHNRPFAKLKIPDWTKHLDPAIFSMPKAFKEAGYTSASIGKWHLGGPDYYPEKHGFDLNIGGTERGQPPSYFSPYNIPTLEDGPKGEFLTDRCAEEACNWIETNRDKPFFLYLPHFAVHTPLMGKPEVIKKYEAKMERLGIDDKNATYAALVESVDDSIGTIRKKLDELKLTEKTVIFFTSDNGGLIGGGKRSITTNPPFRAGKGSAYEGGVRVSFIVSWPGVTKPGSTCDTPVITHDILPTLAAGCDLKIPETHTVDGVDITPLLKGERIAERALYWHYPHYHPGGATPYSAVRQGDWRLVEFFEDGRTELYNLKEDVGETTNLYDKLPDRAKELHGQLIEWRDGVKAQLPTPNPDYAPEKSGQPLRKKK